MRSKLTRFALAFAFLALELPSAHALISATMPVTEVIRTVKKEGIQSRRLEYWFAPGILELVRKDKARLQTLADLDQFQNVWYSPAKLLEKITDIKIDGKEAIHYTYVSEIGKMTDRDATAFMTIICYDIVENMLEESFKTSQPLGLNAKKQKHDDCKIYEFLGFEKR